MGVINPHLPNSAAKSLSTGGPPLAGRLVVVSKHDNPRRQVDELVSAVQDVNTSGRVGARLRLGAGGSLFLPVASSTSRLPDTPYLPAPSSPSLPGQPRHARKYGLTRTSAVPRLSFPHNAHFTDHETDSRAVILPRPHLDPHKLRAVPAMTSAINTTTSNYLVPVPCFVSSFINRLTLWPPPLNLSISKSIYTCNFHPNCIPGNLLLHSSFTFVFPVLLSTSPPLCPSACLLPCLCACWLVHLPAWDHHHTSQRRTKTSDHRTTTTLLP